MIWENESKNSLLFIKQPNSYRTSRSVFLTCYKRSWLCFHPHGSTPKLQLREFGLVILSSKRRGLLSHSGRSRPNLPLETCGVRSK